MYNEHINKVKDYYDKLIDQFGDDPRACDYGREMSRKIKFEVLCGIGDLNGKSILEAGCGMADFYGYLNAHYKNTRYTGVDITPKMVERAAQKYPGVDARVVNLLDGSYRQEHDYVFANGLFYLESPELEALTYGMIDAMWRLAREGVAFNLTSVYADFKNDGERYWQPEEIFKRCKAFCKNVVLRHDYMSHDFTVYLYKSDKDYNFRMGWK